MTEFGKCFNVYDIGEVKAMYNEAAIGEEMSLFLRLEDLLQKVENKEIQRINRLTAANRAK